MRHSPCSLQPSYSTLLILLLEFVLNVNVGSGTYMKEWWSYDGFSGPNFWGLVNQEWRMCAKGLHQSPINVDPTQLLFDPNIQPLHMDKISTVGELANTGQQLVIKLNESRTGYTVNVTGGPLASYKYKLHHILFHFPRHKKKASEHTVDGERFPAEVQLLGYNTNLYANFTEAMTRPQGLLGIAVMIDLIDQRKRPGSSNVELAQITSAIRKIKYKGQKTLLKSFSPRGLLPDTTHFVTYEGSLTYPGCYETVTWIILNKPVYITTSHLKIWQNSLVSTGEYDGINGGNTDTNNNNNNNNGNSESYLGDNVRPLKELNTRLIRTNINFRTKEGNSCPTMYKEMYYKANPWRKAETQDRNIQNDGFLRELPDSSSSLVNSFDYTFDSDTLV